MTRSHVKSEVTFSRYCMCVGISKIAECGNFEERGVSLVAKSLSKAGEQSELALVCSLLRVETKELLIKEGLASGQ